ncbi:MAG: aminopeptidase [Nanoarchaeota archaeon]|nr:aminopeptidase [Nanoarchaeota archaeon]MBU1643801.1 aminopeptidase [Nanoarchaeota archaeon]MBU1977334.1 aminopeptidase [Nanoarchaeota archaeon]
MSIDFLHAAQKIALTTALAATVGCGSQFKPLNDLNIEAPNQTIIDDKLQKDLKFIDEVVDFTLEKYHLEKTKHYRKYYPEEEKVKTLYILNVTHPFILPDDREENFISLRLDAKFREPLPKGFAYFQSFEDNLKDEKDFFKDELGYDVFWRSTDNYNSSSSEGSPITKNFLSLPKARQALTISHEICHEDVAEKISKNFPSSLDESYCMFRGYIIAAGFAKKKTTEYSGLYEETSSKIEHFNKFASNISSYYGRLNEIYGDKGLTKDEKNLLRLQVFNEAKDELDWEEVNNARLYDYWPYVKHYPLFLKLYQSQGEDLDKMQQIMDGCPDDENKAVVYIKNNLGQYPLKKPTLTAPLNFYDYFYETINLKIEGLDQPSI